jgi:hypothetical protein
LQNLGFFFKKIFYKKKKEIKKKKKGEIGVAGATPCPKNGVAGPPHFWPRGGRPPHTGRMGVAEATPGLWGWSGHPERPKKKKKRKKWVWDFGGGRTTPKGLGVASATPYQNGVARPPHFLGKGWLQPPRFLLFFFFFFFNFLLFFIKFFLKKNPKFCKTTPFCPKRHCFGQAQNGVVLEWRV